MFIAGSGSERTVWNILESFETEYSSLLRDREHITDPANRERIREAFRAELFDPLAELMRAGLAAGELRPEKPETLVLLFLGMLNSFIGKAEEIGQDHPAGACRAGDGARLPSRRRSLNSSLNSLRKEPEICPGSIS